MPRDLAKLARHVKIVKIVVSDPIYLAKLARHVKIVKIVVSDPIYIYNA